MNDQVLFGSTNNIISLQLRDHGIDVVPSSCTLDIYDQYGTALLEDQSITPGEDGTCSYILVAALTADLSENNRAMWTVTVSAKTYTFNTLFDVVLSIIRNSLLDQDLVDECDALMEYNYCHSGNADSGNTTSLTDNELMGFADNYFKGGLIEFVDGTNQNNSRIVSAYDPDLGKITWTTALSSSCDTTTAYILRRTFQRQIDAAFREMCNYIDTLGNRPGLIVDDERLKTPHKFLALSKICLSLMKEANDAWMVRADTYEKKYYATIAGLKFREASELEDYSTDEKNVSFGFRR